MTKTLMSSAGKLITPMASKRMNEKNESYIIIFKLLKINLAKI